MDVVLGLALLFAIAIPVVLGYFVLLAATLAAALLGGAAAMIVGFDTMMVEPDAVIKSR